MRILIVDDDYTSRMKLKAMLSSYGDCDIAPDGDVATALYYTAHEEMVPYELITMDVNLPDNQGQDIVRYIREWEKENNHDAEDKRSKILMISVSADPDDVIKSYKTGCEEYLVKPVLPERLTESLAKLDIFPET